MFNSESLKIFYLSNNISCWIPKWIDDVLHFRLTAFLLVQVSQAIIDKVTSVGKKHLSVLSKRLVRHYRSYYIHHEYRVLHMSMYLAFINRVGGLF